jgi:hypothetical protein
MLAVRISVRSLTGGFCGLRICGERRETRAKHLPDLILDLIGVTRAID